MNISLSIVFYVEGKPMCFRHAAQAAVRTGAEVEPVIDEFGRDGNDMRDISCHICQEQNKEE